MGAMKRRYAAFALALALAGSARAAAPAATGWPPDIGPGKPCGPEKIGQFVKLKTAEGKPDGAFVCGQTAAGQTGVVWVPAVPLKDSGLSATGPASSTRPATTKAPAPAGTRAVTVEISGTSDDVTITYVVDSETKQVEHVPAAKVGAVTVDVPPGTKFAVLLRNWSSTGPATCRVTVKGFPQTLRKTAAGVGDRADCAFTVP